MSRRQTRIIQKVFIAITVPTISLCVTLIALYAVIPRSATTVTTTQKPTPNTPDSMPASVDIAPPTQLNIENISVAAAIYPVGLTSAGDMDIDESPTELAWYKLGPKPGEEGSAVIAGHYGWKDGIPSVFNDLNKLVKGDKLSIVGEDGQMKEFVVNRTAVYAPDQDATDVFRSYDGKAHLNLITCQGAWNNTTHTYTERLVIFTDYIQ